MLRRKRNSVTDPAGEGTGIIWSSNSARSGRDGRGSELYCACQLSRITHPTLDGNHGHEHKVVEGKRIVLCNPWWLGWGEVGNVIWNSVGLEGGG